jgi:hypothetical protein
LLLRLRLLLWLLLLLLLRLLLLLLLVLLLLPFGRLLLDLRLCCSNHPASFRH